MPDSIEVMVGRIDERTASIQLDVQTIQKNITNLYQRSDSLRSQLDTLQAEHNDRKSDCVQTNITPNIPKWLIATASGGGIFGMVSLIILLIILTKLHLL